MLSYLARHDDAVREAQLALSLDPVAHYTNNRLGYDFYWARRYDEAIDQFQKTLDLDRSFSLAYIGLGRAYLEKGMGQEAILALEKGNKGNSLVFAGESPHGILGFAYAAVVEKDKALKVVEQLKVLQDQGDPDATFYLDACIRDWAIRIEPWSSCKKPTESVTPVWN